MSRAVYSTRFAWIAVSSGTTSTLFTVPSGKVAVVTDVDLWNWDSSTGQCELGEGTSGVTVQLLVAAGGTQAPPWRTRFVLQAGETLSFTRSSGKWLGQVSGYLLTA